MSKRPESQTTLVKRYASGRRYDAIVADHHDKAGEELVEELRSHGSKVEFINTDVRKRDDADRTTRLFASAGLARSLDLTLLTHGSAKPEAGARPSKPLAPARSRDSGSRRARTLSPSVGER